MRPAISMLPIFFLTVIACAISLAGPRETAIAGAYQTCLYRTAAPGEIAAWAATKMGDDQIVDSICHYSHEAKIQDAFRRYANRAPNSGDLAYWLPTLGQGYNEDDFRAAVFAYAGGTNARPRGFNPYFNQRRIASTVRSHPYYFESFPDGGSGAAPGQGFFTLANGTGETTLGCKENSAAPTWMDQTVGAQYCPFWFNWWGATASLVTDNTGWSTPVTRNVYHGLQENLPQGGDTYFGGNNLGSVDFRYTDVVLDVAVPRVVDAGATGRVLVGIGIYEPHSGVSYGIEINIGEIFPANQRRYAPWSITSRIAHARSTVDASGHTTVSYYLGGIAWGVVAGSVVNVGQVGVRVPWRRILRQLAAENYLPADVIRGGMVSVVYTGTEIMGRMRVVNNVARFTQFDAP